MVRGSGLGAFGAWAATKAAVASTATHRTSGRVMTDSFHVSRVVECRTDRSAPASRSIAPPCRMCDLVREFLRQLDPLAVRSELAVGQPVGPGFLRAADL